MHLKNDAFSKKFFLTQLKISAEKNESIQNEIIFFSQNVREKFY